MNIKYASPKKKKLVSVAPIGAKMWNSPPLDVINFLYIVRETKVISF